MPYETDTLINQIPIAPAMNKRGDLPKSYVQSTAVQPLTQEEYDKALEEARNTPMFDHQTPNHESTQSKEEGSDKPDYKSETLADHPEAIKEW